MRFDHRHWEYFIGTKLMACSYYRERERQTYIIIRVSACSGRANCGSSVSNTSTLTILLDIRVSDAACIRLDVVIHTRGTLPEPPPPPLLAVVVVAPDVEVGVVPFVVALEDRIYHEY